MKQESRKQGKRQGRFALWLFCLAAALFPATQLMQAAEPRYTFGVVPQFEQRKLHAVWAPIVRELDRRTGLAVELDTSLTIQDFEKRFLQGHFDFVYMNPYHVIKTRRLPGYIPLVSDEKPLHGILVVRKDSPVTRVQELAGKTVAFSSPNAPGASLLMRADLERLHHVKVKPVYVKTHSSVYLHVATGLAEAGGGLERTLQEQPEAVRDSLRVLYATRSIPANPVAAHPRVPQEDREKVRRAFLAMSAAAEGRALLSEVPIEQVVPVSPDDYRAMLGWGLDDYWDDSWSGG